MSDETPLLPATDGVPEPSRRRRRLGRRATTGVAVAGVVIVAGGVITAVALGSSDGHGRHHGSEIGGRVSGMTGQQVIGTVTAVGSATFSITSEGSSKTYTITSDTSIVSSGGPASLTGLKSGDAVVVVVDSATTIGGNVPAAAVYSGTLPVAIGGRHTHGNAEHH